MKTLSIISTALVGLLTSLGASAQTTVTLYGIADAGISRVTGLANGSQTAVVSGIMEGSRFGFRGNEDLGGGYRAIFTLENRFEMDTGSVSNRPASGLQLPDRVTTTLLANLPAGPATAPTVAALNAALAGSALGVNVGPDGNRFFDRQAFVGMITPFGAFTAGRQYTPAYLVQATFDASQTQSSLAAGQVASLPAAFDIRLSNTIQYGIQAAGVTATLMYGAGERAGNSKGDSFVGAMAIYKGDGFSAGLGYNQKRNEFGQKSLRNTVAGATVNLGPGTAYGMYATIKDDNPSGLSPLFATLGPAAPVFQNAYNVAFRQDARLMHIGYRLTTGPHTIVTAFNRLNDKRAVNADTDSYGVTYTYALSKRTNLNAVLTRFNNKDQGQVGPGGNGYIGGVTASAGTDSTNIAFGIRHAF